VAATNAAAGAWLLPAAYAHLAYAKRRARAAPPPARSPADPDYGERFLLLAQCDARSGSGAGPLACARFIRHAFFGAPPESLPRAAVAGWLRRHLGDSATTDESIAALEAALGPYAPAADGSDMETPAFVYGEGPLEAWHKPLALRLFLEGQRLMARIRLAAAGFEERRDPTLPALKYWERRGEAAADAEPPLVVLHGYGRGLASPLFEKIVPELGRRSVIIVDCSWLLVARVPKSADVTRTPTVREIAAAVACYLSDRIGIDGTALEVDLLAHSFGTAVASALARELAEAGHRRGPLDHSGGSAPSRPAVAVRRAVLMDPMCFLPGITKQAQLLRRMPRDLAAELVEESSPGAPTPSYREVLGAVVRRPHPSPTPSDEATAARERRRWVIFQTYFFFYFIFRDLVYSWVNLRSLQGPDYLDRGYLRNLNRHGRLLTVLAETDTMIPAPLLRDDLSAEAPVGSAGGVLWLPTVGHGACQHRDDVVERINTFLAAA